MPVLPTPSPPLTTIRVEARTMAINESAQNPEQRQDLAALYAERCRLDDLLDAATDLPDDEIARRCAEVKAIDQSILDADPASLADVATQLHTLYRSKVGAFLDEDAMTAEVAKLATRTDRFAGSKTTLLALWHEHVALVAKVNSGEGTDPDRDRLDRIGEQLDSARPTDIGGLAVQVEWLTYCLEIGHAQEDVKMAGSVAARLAALAGLALPARPHA
jgi:hypothetical protein